MTKFCCTTLWLLTALAASAAEPSTTLARIAFLSDTHLNLRTNEPGPAFVRRVDQAIKEVNAAKVDLVLIAGDETDGGRLEQMALLKQKLKQLAAPVLFVPGNHDVGMAARGANKASITSERVKRFAQVLGPNWFAREVAGLRIIGVNSCLLDSDLPEADEQWKFLESELAKPSAKPTFLLEHYPLFIKSVDEPLEGYWNVPPEPRQRLLKLIHQGGVKTVLTGHLHYPITNRVDGVLFLGNGPTSFGLPKGKTPEGWLLLRVPTEGEVQFDFHRLEP